MNDEQHVSSLEVAYVAPNEAPRDSSSQSCKISKYHSEKRHEESSTESMLDPENRVPAISIETSDEEGDTCERLPADVDETTNQLRRVTDVESAERDRESILCERTQKLRSKMTGLREELNREVALWRKEREEFQRLREQSDALAFQEATAAARAAAVAYAIESPLSGDLSNIVDITSEHSIQELAILEYEKNLAKYQDSYSSKQAEQRYNLYKRALVDAYKRRLTEVERLCDEELEGLRQSANCLQSFKEIASRWSVNENNHGDTNRDVCRSDAEQSKIVEMNFDKNSWCVFGKVDNEVNMIPEILSARFKGEDMTQ